MNKEQISIFPTGEKNDAFVQYFVGQSYLNNLLFMLAGPKHGLHFPWPRKFTEKRK